MKMSVCTTWTKDQVKSLCVGFEHFGLLFSHQQIDTNLAWVTVLKDLFTMEHNFKVSFLVRQILALANTFISPLSDMNPPHNQPWWPSLQSNQAIWKQAKWQTNQWLLIFGTLSPHWFNYLLWWGRAARQWGREARPTTLWLMGPGPRKWVIQQRRRVRGGTKKDKRNYRWRGERKEKKKRYKWDKGRPEIRERGEREDNCDR